MTEQCRHAEQFRHASQVGDPLQVEVSEQHPSAFTDPNDTIEIALEISSVDTARIGFTPNNEKAPTGSITPRPGRFPRVSRLSEPCELWEVIDSRLGIT